MTFLGRFLRSLAWIVAVGIVGVVAMNLLAHHDTAPVTDGVCDQEDASPAWYADPDCTGPEPIPFAPFPASVPVATTPAPVTEDGNGWDCRTRGNHVCGPGSAYPAGCYVNSNLAVAWSNYTDPRLDPLWAQVEPPC